MDKLLKTLQANALESPATLARMLDKSEDEIKQQIAHTESGKTNLYWSYDWSPKPRLKNES